jgi:hypothetical protein
MRPGRENLVVAAGAFLFGMLVTLVAGELWSEPLKPATRWLALGLIFLLAVAVNVLGWWLSGRAAGNSGKTTTLEEWGKEHTAKNENVTEPPAPKESRGGGAREPERTNPQPVPPAGWSQPTPSPVPRPVRNPVPPATPASPTALQTPDGFGGASWTEGASRADSSRLVDVWEVYLKSGSRFNEAGLRRQLSASQIDAEVIPGSQFGGGDIVHAVDLKDGSGILYLLPDFAKPPRALEEWFHSRDSGSRMARIQRLVRPATARRSGGRINLESKGEIE